LRADDGGEVGPELEAQLHLKILSYDRSLRAHTNGRVVVGVIYRADHDESLAAVQTMVAAFLARGRKSPVQGMPVHAVALPLDAKNVARRIQDQGVTALYITPGLDDSIGYLASLALTTKLPTMTGRRSQLNSGLAVAVVAKEGKPAIIVNLPVARALDMDLDPALLRVAEVKK
jgi:hypothetical protein